MEKISAVEYNQLLVSSYMEQVVSSNNSVFCYPWVFLTFNTLIKPVVIEMLMQYKEISDKAVNQIVSTVS